MNIKLILVGKTQDAYLEEGIRNYSKRLDHYVNFEMITLTPPKLGKKVSATLSKEKEGELILKNLESNEYVVLLDDKGKQYSSADFAMYMQKKMNSGAKVITFIVGGPFGFSNDVYQRANEKLSLSKMTFSHEMIRLFFTEQLYRAFSILRGEKYHHD